MKTKTCPYCDGDGEEPGAPISLTDGKALCSRCKGTGVIPVNPPKIKQCERCQVVLYRPLVDGKFKRITEKFCPSCQNLEKLSSALDRLLDAADGLNPLYDDGSRATAYTDELKELSQAKDAARAALKNHNERENQRQKTKI